MITSRRRLKGAPDNMEHGRKAGAPLPAANPIPDRGAQMEVVGWPGF